MSDQIQEATDRYSRQALFWGIGEEGQKRLRASRAVVVGCGALGCAQVSFLARAGVGKLRVVDRDLVELSNLQRQILFEEADAAAAVPKAIAAARAVSRLNSEVEVEPLVADVTPANVLHLLANADVVLDGTDNLETRYLLNNACVKLGIPWVYGGALGSAGMSVTVLPHETACFRCFFRESPPAGSMPTCETAGIIAPTVATLAAVQVAEAMKILVGDRKHLNRGIIIVDLWMHDYERTSTAEPDPECPCCVRGQYDYLEASATSRTTSLCGRNAVQVTPSTPQRLMLAELGQRLEPAGQVFANEYMVRLVVGTHELTVFPDGRAIVKGTNDEALARSLYARYVGT